MHKTFLLVLSCFCSLLFAEPSYITFPSDIDWQMRESEHFQIIYRQGSETFANRALKSAEKAYHLLVPIFVEAPEKTWIVLADFQDSTNGYALNFPYSHIVVFAAPPEASGQLSNLDDWLDSLLLHEYVHILHLYPAHGLWSIMRFLFGTWVVPNGMMPSHFHEGMATFLETEKTRGGRGRGTLFPMYRRKAVEAGVWGESFAPLDLMDGTVSRWPHGVSAYFFGETLTRELWARKGAKGIYSLTQSHSDNWPFFINLPLNQVYGLDYSDLWKDIFKKTTESAKKEIAQIQTQPVSKLHYLTQTRYQKGDPTLSPDGTRVAYRIGSPYRDSSGIQVMEIKSGKILNDFALTMGTTESMCWGKVPSGEKLLFINQSQKNLYSTNGVFGLDPLTGEQFSMEGQNSDPLSHVHRLACSPDLRTLYVYQEVGGVGTLLEAEGTFSAKRNTAKLLRSWKLPQGTWISSILASEPALFTLRQGVQTHFYEWKKGSEPEHLFSLDSYAFSLKQGTAPREVWAIISLDGRDEIWSVNLSTKTLTKKVALVGGVNGFDQRQGNIVVSSYEHGGYDIATATAVPPMRTVATQGKELDKIDFSLPKISTGEEYSPAYTIFPRTWLPNLLFVPQGAQVGAVVTWFDLSQRHLYSAFGGYDTRGSLFGDLGYNYRFGGKFTNDWGAYYNPNYSVNRKQFIKRWGGAVGLSSSLAGFLPTIRLAAVFGRVEGGYGYQSIGGEIDASYRFGFSRRPLSISPVNGVAIGVSHQQFFKGLGSSFNYFVSSAKVDGYVEAPWWKDSVWFLGSRLGYTEGSPLFNSYFEGGGEVLFSQARGVFLNRGFLAGTFFARRMFTANLEYRFPLWWVERGLGLKPIRLNVLHAALVADALSMDFGPSAVTTTGIRVPQDLFKKYYYSAGIELKSDWKFGYYLPAQFRVGAYRGFGPLGEDLQIACGVEASL